MKSKTKKAVLFFLLGFFIPVAAAIPMIINRDNSYLTIGLIASAAMYIVGLIVLFRKPAHKS
jgi:hypothetical protein